MGGSGVATENVRKGKYGTMKTQLFENERKEYAAQRLQGWKMRVKKMQYKTVGMENAGKENAVQDCRGEKCGKSDVCFINI